MKLTCEGPTKTSRGFVLLAPPQSDAHQFAEVVDDIPQYQRLLAGAQKLRGGIYVRDGAIQRRELTADGRHVQPADAISWHLLTVDENEKVLSCIRYLAHRPGVRFRDLAVARLAEAQSPAFAQTLREAVQTELAYASQRGFSYVELGGWAISEEMRCSSEALRMLLTDPAK